MKKAKKPWSLRKAISLLLLQLVLDMGWLFAGAYIYQKIANPEALGHPAPGVTIIFAVIAAVITMTLVVYIALKTFSQYVRSSSSRPR